MDYDKKMQKNVIKFFGGVLGLVAVGAALYYGMQWYENRNSPEYALKQKYEKLMEQYRNDTYGGDTPEETLRLFIDALKAGDTDLAAKYFVVDKQAEWKEKLGQLKNKNLLLAMANDLSREKEKKELDPTRVVFYIYNDEDKLAVAIDMGSGPNGKWKILEL